VLKGKEVGNCNFRAADSTGHSAGESLRPAPHPDRLIGDQRADRLAESSAEVGLLFNTVVLTTGPIWGKPIWGTWWTWDSRLTTTLVLWLLYAGYLTLRAMADEVSQVGRLAAVVGIVAAADVPVIIVSVRLWRTIHPAVIVTRQGSHGLEDPRMIATLLVSLAAFTVLSAWLLMLRFATLRAAARLTNLGRQLALTEAEMADRSAQPNCSGVTHEVG